jgi:hypothetical protein
MTIGWRCDRHGNMGNKKLSQIVKVRNVLKEVGINGRIIEREDVDRNRLSRKGRIQWRRAVRNRLVSLEVAQHSGNFVTI